MLLSDILLATDAGDLYLHCYRWIFTAFLVHCVKVALSVRYPDSAAKKFLRFVWIGASMVPTWSAGVSASKQYPQHHFRCLSCVVYCGVVLGPIAFHVVHSTLPMTVLMRPLSLSTSLQTIHRYIVFADCIPGTAKHHQHVARWMRSNRLQLNAAKTESLWSTTGRRSHQLMQSPL